MDLLLILMLTVINGVLAMSELAVVSARRARLQQRVEQEKSQGAQAALDLADDPNRFLSTVQIGITLVGVMAGAFGGAGLADDFARFFARIPALEAISGQLGFLSVVLMTTYLSLVIGELVPKRLAIRNPEGVASVIAPPMKVLSRITAPIVWLLSRSTETVLWLLGVRGEGSQHVTEEEINVMLQEGARAGVFRRSEPQMVAGVLRLDDLRAEALMTPRTEVAWLDVNGDDEAVRHVLADHHYSRYPVCDGELDSPLGIVRTGDLLQRSLRGEALDLRAALIPPIFVPHTTSAADVLDRMREQPAHMALVIGEFGGVEGVLTLTDLIEAVVGDIGTPEATRRDDGSWLVDGLMPVEEFRALLDLHLPLPGEEEELFQSMGGFIGAQLGRVPDTGDSVTWEGLRFEVADMDGQRVDKLLVSPLPADETDAATSPDSP